MSVVYIFDFQFLKYEKVSKMEMSKRSLNKIEIFGKAQIYPEHILLADIIPLLAKFNLSIWAESSLYESRFET